MPNSHYREVGGDGIDRRVRPSLADIAFGAFTPKRTSSWLSSKRSGDSRTLTRSGTVDGPERDQNLSPCQRRVIEIPVRSFMGMGTLGTRTHPAPARAGFSERKFAGQPESTPPDQRAWSLGRTIFESPVWDLRFRSIAALLPFLKVPEDRSRTPSSHPRTLSS